MSRSRARGSPIALFYAFFLAERAVVSSGRINEGLAEINEAQRYAEKSESLWCMPEVLRIKGEILAKRDPADLGAIEDHFTRSLAWLRRQEALSWELRAATSLARFWKERRRFTGARELLDSVHSRFAEGFATADLRAAMPQNKPSRRRDGASVRSPPRRHSCRMALSIPRDDNAGPRPETDRLAPQKRSVETARLPCSFPAPANTACSRPSNRFCRS